jgi:hypothetical protein
LPRLVKKGSPGRYTPPHRLSTWLRSCCSIRIHPGDGSRMEEP